jgi:hypothetical protein
VFTALNPSNPKKGNAVLTLVMLADITAIDVISANAFTTPHMRKAVA